MIVRHVTVFCLSRKQTMLTVLRVFTYYHGYPHSSGLDCSTIIKNGFFFHPCDQATFISTKNNSIFAKKITPKTEI